MNEIIKNDCQLEGTLDTVNRDLYVAFRQLISAHGKMMVAVMDDVDAGEFKLSISGKHALLGNKFALTFCVDPEDVEEKIASLQSQLKEAREALQKIADQKLFEELTTEEQDDACFSDGYDWCVETARKFLSQTEGNDD